MEQGDKNTKLSELFTWPLIVTIIGGIVVGLVLLAISPTEEVSVWVRVLDKSTGSPVEFATVTLDVAGGGPTMSESTDSNGFARFLLNSDLNGMPALVAIRSDSYDTYTQYVDLVPQSGPYTMLLTEKAPGITENSPTLTPTSVPTITPTPTTSPTATPTYTVTPPIIPVSEESELSTPTPSVPEKGERIEGMLPGGEIRFVRVFVPGGTFRRGSWAGTEAEQPVHEVTLGSFWIDRMEISNEQFAEFLNAKGPTEPDGTPRIDLDDNAAWIEIRSGEFRPKDGRDDYPVAMVNWFGAVAYCEWAGGRLPTEAEWEYAARGNGMAVYPWGNAEPDCDLANFNHSSEGFCARDKKPVSELGSGTSWSGAINMAGNVSEWVADWYDPSYYERLPDEGIENPLGPSSGREKVIRGGAWYSSAADLTTFDRRSFDPNSGDNGLGFRCIVPEP